MSVKHSLLALLADGEKYGAQLKSEFEERTESAWPLNIGQIYTTLDRLVRDGLVEQAGGPDAEGRIAYRLTQTGRVEAERWFTEPTALDENPRAEVAIKIALAVTLEDVDAEAVLRTQRSAAMAHLQALTRRKADAARTERLDPEPDRFVRDELAALAHSLVLERLIFSTEAEIRWLDHVSIALRRSPATNPRTPSSHRASRSDTSGGTR